MNDPIGFAQLRDFYAEHLREQVMPFWEPLVDWEYGGLNNCVENDRTGSVSFSGQAPTYQFGSPRVHGLIFPGRNRITITAEDYAGNTGAQTITVWYDPLGGEAELLVIAPTQLRPPLVWLRSWKRLSGISCNILSLE